MPSQQATRNASAATIDAAFVIGVANRVSAIEQLLGLESRRVPLDTSSAGYVDHIVDEVINGEDGLEDAVVELEHAALEPSGIPDPQPSRPSSPGAQFSSVRASADQSRSAVSIWLRNSEKSQTANSFDTISGTASAIDRLIAALPSTSVCRTLLDAFFQHIDVFWHYVHTPTFQEECHQFLSADPSRSFDLLDPAWLALFANAIARGARAIIFSGTDDNIRPDLHAQLHAVSQQALLYAEWTSRPQVRVIQTLIGTISILLRTESTFFSGPGDTALGGRKHGRILLSIAIALARELGLDRMTSDASPQTHPALRDLAFPAFGADSLRLEICRRLRFSLLALDAKAFIGHDSSRHIRPGSYTTPLPLRVNDHALCGHHDPLPVELPTSVSDADSVIYQFYTVELIDNTSSGPATHEQILKLDALLRPRLMQLTGRDVGDSSLLAEAPATKLFIIASFHARLLRIHRPLYLKGLRLERYAASSQTCIKCAQVILAVYSTPVLHSRESMEWFIFSQVTSATTVLILAHLYRVRQRARVPSQSADEDEELRNATRPAKELFNRGLQSKSTVIRSTAQQCLRILEPLWRARLEDLTNVQQGNSTDSDSLVELLRRLSKKVYVEESSTQSGPSETSQYSMDMMSAWDDAMPWPFQHAAAPPDPFPFLSNFGLFEEGDASFLPRGDWPSFNFMAEAFTDSSYWSSFAMQ